MTWFSIIRRGDLMKFIIVRNKCHSNVTSISFSWWCVLDWSVCTKWPEKGSPALRDWRQHRSDQRLEHRPNRRELLDSFPIINSHSLARHGHGQSVMAVPLCCSFAAVEWPITRTGFTCTMPRVCRTPAVWSTVITAVWRIPAPGGPP